jgi:mercuric ion transport protein
MQERARSRIAVEGLHGASLNREQTRTRLVAAGGVAGALVVSSCCVLPLILFSLGVSGAWIGSLTALAPYKPYFLPPTIGLLGYGYCLVYLRPKQTCAGGSCAHPLPDRLVKLSLWTATVLVVSALAFDFVAAWLLA